MNNKEGIRVLHVTPWFPPHKGGIAYYVSNLCNRLTSEGYNVSIITVKQLMDRMHYDSSINYSNIERMSCFYLPGWPYPTLKSVSVPVDAGAKILSIIKRSNFDIIHAHGIHYPICWEAIYLANKRKIPSVLSLHGTYALNPNVLSGETRIERWLYAHLFSRVFSYADAVIGPAKSITCLAQKYYGGSSTSFYTVEYGINTEKFAQNLDKKIEYRDKYGIREDATVILFSGRFEKVKGILEFCKAVKKIVEETDRRIQAVIIGTGTLGYDVDSIIRNVPGIYIFGWQPEEKVHEFYIASDIFVVPSRFEGMPITILEAMNAGLHIIYTPVGGIPDILDGYPSKTMLNAISDVEIYETLVTVLSRGIHIHNDNRANSLKYASKFDWKYISNKIIRIYDQLII